MANAKFEADFQYVRERINEFFGRRAIGKSLALIDELGITGWEKWWQVEFATWLADHDRIGEWVMEEVFNTDLRRNTKKSSIAIDIGFRMKGFSTKEMIFLELKQNNDMIKCIDNMLSDAEKVYTAQQYSTSGLMIRNFFVVGIYPTPIDANKTVVHDYISDRAEELNVPVKRSSIYTKFIPESPYSVTLF